MTVMLHAGVFVERQYCTFAGIAHGQKTHNFLQKLIEWRFASAIPVGPLHRGRLFHVHYKPLYAAIGEPDNRHRKPAPVGRMIERLMILDAVLDDRTRTWLGTETDKRRYFMRQIGERVNLDEFPRLTFGEGPTQTIRLFPDKLPIGLPPVGGVRPGVSVPERKNLPGMGRIFQRGQTFWIAYYRHGIERATARPSLRAAIFFGKPRFTAASSQPSATNSTRA